MPNVKYVKLGGNKTAPVVEQKPVEEPITTQEVEPEEAPAETPVETNTVKKMKKVPMPHSKPTPQLRKVSRPSSKQVPVVEASPVVEKKKEEPVIEKKEEPVISPVTEAKTEPTETKVEPDADIKKEEVKKEPESPMAKTDGIIEDKPVIRRTASSLVKKESKRPAQKNPYSSNEALDEIQKAAAIQQAYINRVPVMKAEPVVEATVIKEPAKKQEKKPVTFKPIFRDEPNLNINNNDRTGDNEMDGIVDQLADALSEKFVTRDELQSLIRSTITSMAMSNVKNK